VEVLIVAAVLALAGWRLYVHGKSAGSRRGAGYRRGRRKRHESGDGRRR
jgi:hypothetical protein